MVLFLVPDLSGRSWFYFTDLSLLRRESAVGRCSEEVPWERAPSCPSCRGTRVPRGRRGPVVPGQDWSGRGCPCPALRSCTRPQRPLLLRRALQARPAPCPASPGRGLLTAQTPCKSLQSSPAALNYSPLVFNESFSLPRTWPVGDNCREGKGEVPL